MKKLLFPFILIIALIPFQTFCSKSVNDRIEQVYSCMPEIQVYVDSETNDNDSFSGYMNTEKLEFSDSKPFNREEGISFVFMFDCSTSVTGAQMTAMKKCVSDYIENSSYQKDKFVIVAFGEKVEILSDANSTKAETLAAISSLRNNQNATALFDAVNELNNISENMDDTYPKKSMGIVFTDAVDYNIGGITKEELLDAASKTSIPLYVVAINPNNKSSVDMLGQVARKSGGEIQVAKGGNIASAFEAALSNTENIKVLTFRAKSNIVTDEPSTLKIVSDSSPNVSMEREFITNTWQKDVTPPQVENVDVVSDKSIRVVFTEYVDNASKASNYTVKKGSKDYKISSVLYDENTHSAVLSFEDMIGKGKYTISFANIADHSMEKNFITEKHSFEVTGFKAAMLNFGNFMKHAWWVFVIIAFLIVALIMMLVIKKRKGIIMVDGKATFADNVKYEPIPAKPLPTRHIRLVMEAADGSGTNLDINIVQSIIFGRSESCEVTIDDCNLSRQHFAIELEGDELFIQNLSQTNGTYVNGIMLNSKRKLSLGDVIAAGQEKFTLRKI